MFQWNIKKVQTIHFPTYGITKSLIPYKPEWIIYRREKNSASITTPFSSSLIVS